MTSASNSQIVHGSEEGKEKRGRGERIKCSKMSFILSLKLFCNFKIKGFKLQDGRLTVQYEVKRLNILS